MATTDLNTDCGEGYGPWSMGDDRGILAIATTANIACGGHAGDPDTIVETIRTARDNGVAVGAHPGYDDPKGFGRRVIPMSEDAIERMVAHQIGAFLGVAALEGTPVTHVKPHGALNNIACRDRGVADAIARAVKAVMPDTILLAVARTELYRAGEAAGLRVAAEVFADRTYRSDATLTPRSEPNAVIHDADEAARRVVRMVESGAVFAEDGTVIETPIDSICVHGDEPSAVAVARRVRDALEERGHAVMPFAGRLNG